MRSFSGFLLLLPVGLLLASAAGCELVSKVDRGAIGDGTTGGETTGGGGSETNGIPAELASTEVKSTMGIKLNFPSQTEFDATKHLSILFVKSANPAETCKSVWSKALDLKDPARLNVQPYPLPPGTELYEPGQGEMAMFIYTHEAIPGGFCLKESDCAAFGFDASAPDASDGGGVCTAAGAGLGACGATATTLPRAGGCAVVTIVKDGTSNPEVTLTTRPKG